uniref:Uncharacterized protein n=1 Tax=Anguilla anguilla TaxID=7936 RepID=A0A0E9U4Z3_ANGAN
MNKRESNKPALSLTPLRGEVTNM